METDDESKADFTQDYLRQLNGLITTAIQQRYDFLQLIDDQIDEGFSLQCTHYRSQALLLGFYAATVTFLPSILLYSIGMVLQTNWHKELAFVFIVAGLCTYFVLRAISWSGQYKVKPCEEIGDQARDMIEKFKQTNVLLAQEFHGILSSTSTIMVNAGAREFLEKCIVFGIQVQGKPLMTLESLTDRHITIHDLEHVYNHIQQGNEWLLKSNTLINDIISSYQ